MVKLYTVCALTRQPLLGKHVRNLAFTQVFGSVTQVCKFLKKMYGMSENDARERIVSAFGLSVTASFIVPNCKKDTTFDHRTRDEQVEVVITQHKLETETRVQGKYK